MLALQNSKGNVEPHKGKKHQQRKLLIMLIMPKEPGTVMRTTTNGHNSSSLEPFWYHDLLILPPSFQNKMGPDPLGGTQLNPNPPSPPARYQHPLSAVCEPRQCLYEAPCLVWLVTRLAHKKALADRTCLRMTGRRHNPLLQIPQEAPVSENPPPPPTLPHRPQHHLPN